MKERKESGHSGIPEETRLRKDRDTLIVTGFGVMLYGAWSVVKGFVTLVIDRQNSEIIQEIFAEDGAFGLVIFYALVVLVVAVDLKIRIFVGRRARAEGFGVPGKRNYLWAAVILAVGAFIGAAADVTSRDAGGVLETAASVLVDLTSGVLSIQMIAAALRVRQSERRAAECAAASPDGTGQR